MKDLPQKANLRDGKVVTLRLLTREDTEKLIRFYARLPEEDKLFLREDVTKRDTIVKWTKELDLEKVVPLIAESRRRIVGQASLHMQKHGWARHVGEIRVVVARDHQRNGLGSLMAAKIFRIALGMKLEKILARMMDNQIGARKAFEKLGFKEECILKDHVIDLKGQKHNLVVMSNSVTELWKRMEDMIVYSEMRVIG